MSDDFTTQDFIWQLKHSKDPDERLYAAFKLGRDKQAIVIQPLIEASTDPEFTVRVRVAEALGTRDEAALILPTLQTLITDDNAIVRRTAADSLGNIGAEDGVIVLCQALHDTDETVRSHAAEALGKIASHDSAKALVDAFLHDEDYNVRYFAKQSLGNVGKAAVDALIEVSTDTQETGLLIEICEILGNLADKRSKPLLNTLSEHPDEHIAEMARWALKRIWD
ncbi:MAG: HEAT repeat domain-containing protein [Phototrophicaceae bacterium]